ncbi:lytic transglycosylase domain-containing protein [Ruegeria pomeroyi]|uniref:Transglycosylase, Slt family n=2 Tax=Ruegeria pomeroyi TaxID=89184 RepID=Q5LWW6_RUEPO|nr:lytic transglycosylase domain-containing protein [Ruegeria pomeroyi]HCE70464.1 tail length tape measure protein [Ruegeria sp.]AAV93495.1 transglycosylase, Slt family [Ruegeria pomeroyi DSS-3]NVK96559.1 lytic transglycosylase domain-containing protein [Ruegeria pomeroyi]NVL01584.1 lytic transglycosylase domain-containing protein [Ruegeria pomeroyi]QWV10788.1 lytic transglycosylase domain-containing protein [Ruegeria pomeroyi]
MPLNLITRFAAFVWLSVLFAAAPALAKLDPGVSSLCDQAARSAANRHGVPLDVLRAITRVETGRRSDGQLAPWPWTVNMEGTGHWFPTEFAARKFVFERFKSGARSFDVGCFQINYRWHSQGFSSIEEMFDPERNADYAARFLNDLFGELGSWSAAAGAYHSRTQSLADAYASRFDRTRAALGEGPMPNPHRTPDTGGAQPLFARQEAPPGPARLGSLFATGSGARPFISFN